MNCWQEREGEYRGIQMVSAWYDRFRRVRSEVKDCEATSEVLDGEDDNKE